jgi:hypothetical protein
MWAWLQTHEYVAVWLEGIALVAILFLDWMERKDHRKERREQHEEMSAQLTTYHGQLEA